MEEKYPKGHFLSYGLAIGTPLGIPVGLALGNIAIGPLIGLVIGIIFGTYFEKKYEKEGKIRPLKKAEKERQKKNLWWVLGIGLLVFIGVLAGYFFVR